MVDGDVMTGEKEMGINHHAIIHELLLKAKMNQKIPVKWKLDLNILYKLRVEFRQELRWDEHTGDWMLFGLPIELAEGQTMIVLETRP